MMSLATLTTVCAGIAKPIETADSLGGMYATFMPTTCELASTSAPPELPGEIAASVWIRSTSAWDSWAEPGIVR